MGQNEGMFQIFRRVELVETLILNSQFSIMVTQMDKLIIASMRQSAGKTSVIVGLAKALGKKVGYMKPFGDRLRYRKKRVWDYDAALISSIFGLEENPEDTSLGFDHAKLRYMYDEAGLKAKLLEVVSHIGKDKDVLFIEGGKDLAYGVSIHLDALSLAKAFGGKLLMVMSGDEGAILDDITFVKQRVDMTNIDLGGVILNKVHDVEDFKNTHLNHIAEMGVNVLGIIPYQTALTHFSMDYLSEYLFAKVIAGEDGLNRVVKNILVGAMSADAAFRHPVFQAEDKLIITSGDRSDMVLAALESHAVGIILTNNILPPSNIIAKAADRHIPLLLVPDDTYQTARRIDNLEPLLTKDSVEKIDLLGQLIEQSVNIEGVSGE